MNDPKHYRASVDITADTFNDAEHLGYIEHRVKQMIRDMHTVYEAEDYPDEGGVFVAPTDRMIPAVRIRITLNGRKRDDGDGD